MRAIYLHGFASSPHSGKASYLRQRFAARGVEFLAPDLNAPDFSTLTIRRMLDQTAALIEAPPGQRDVTLIGSSLGAFVAVQAAVEHPGAVRRLILLAPALDFSDTGLSAPGRASVADWKRDGQLMVFHYGYGRLLPISYALYEDARRYDAMRAELQIPVLIFQGRRDTAVDPATVERWAAARPNVELHLLDDDHQLGASLDTIWTLTSRFLDSPPESPIARS